MEPMILEENDFTVNIEVKLPYSKEYYSLTEDEEQDSSAGRETRFKLRSILPSLYSPQSLYSDLCEGMHQLWRLSDNYETKTILLEPKYHLVDFMRAALSSSKLNQQSINSANEMKDLSHQIIGCIWFLSRAIENRAVIGSKENTILKLLLDLIDIPKYTRMILNILMNCSLMETNHSYLTSIELGYLAYLQKMLHENPNDVDLYRSVNYLSLSHTGEHIIALHRHEIPSLMFKHLIKLGYNPFHWPERASGAEYWSLNVMMDIAILSEGAKILHEIGATEYFMALIISYTRSDHCYKIEQMKAMIILINICYYCQASSSACPSSFSLSSSSSIPSSSYLRQHLHQPSACSENLIIYVLHLLTRGDGRRYTLVEFLFDIYTTTVDYPIHLETQLSTSLVRKGWAFGIMTARCLTTTFHHLFALERYYHHTFPVQHKDIVEDYESIWRENFQAYLHAHITLLTKYVRGENSLRIFEGTGFIQAGGGKNDPDVVEKVLENLLQISHFYARNQESEATTTNADGKAEEQLEEVPRHDDDSEEEEEGGGSAYKPLLFSSAGDVIKRSGAWKEIAFFTNKLIRNSATKSVTPQRILLLASVLLEAINELLL